MSTAGDRQAFLRLMGISDTDMFDPLHQTSSIPNVQSSQRNSTTGRAQRVVKHNSSLTSSMGGLSHSASLGGEPTQSSLMATFSTPRDTSPVSVSGPPSSRLFSTPRTVHWEDECTGTASHGSRPSHREAAAAPSSSRTTAAAISEELKEKGNRAFEAGALREAVEHYTAAIDALASGSTHSGAEVLLLAALHSNRSAACLQAAHQLPNAEDAYVRAVWDADQAVSLRPSWFKGYARQGDAYMKLKRYGTAAEAYEMAVKLDPQNHTLVNALEEARQRTKKAAREELEMRRTARSTVSTMSSLGSTMTDNSAPGTTSKGNLRGVSAPPRDQTLSNWQDADRRRSGEAQQLWAQLKHEVEATVHEATGDAYRVQQLERFRARNSNDVSPMASTPAVNTAPTKDAVPVPAKVSTSHLMQKTTVPGPRPGGAFKMHTNENATTAAEGKPSVAPASPFSAEALPSGSQPPASRRRYSSSSPPHRGGTATQPTVDGPVQNAREVPFEFSSAAASAYQQRLLEAYRKRKTAQ